LLVIISYLILQEIGYFKNSHQIASYGDQIKENAGLEASLWTRIEGVA